MPVDNDLLDDVEGKRRGRVALGAMIMSAAVVPPPVLSEDAIRRLLIERVDERCLSVGMVVGVTEADRHRIVAHGCRDTSGAGPVNEKTLFEVGSITKLFTALLLSEMANRGEVRMDEPVAELLPAGTRVPVRDGKAITLRDLDDRFHEAGIVEASIHGTGSMLVDSSFEKN